jgi:hypothetical protein
MSASPNAVSVGGTQFNPNYDAKGNDVGFVAESVWNDGSGATGGGVSKVFPQPSFQQNSPGVLSGAFRLVPDVAMIASPNSPGVFIYNDGQCGNGGPCGTNVATLGEIGGTSLSAPVWSGISKLIMQTNGGTRLGNPDSRIYSLASSNQSGNGFRDVTVGNNSFNSGAGLVSGPSAAPGYDEVTGWGTVDIDKFVTAYASNSATPTPTATSTSSATPTLTPTPTATSTPTPTLTPTPTPTPSPVPAVVKISPPSINFGNVKLGKVKTKKVRLTNTASKKGGATVTFNGGIISGSADFVGATSCSGPVPPKHKCLVVVGFRPSTTGTQSATVIVNSNASNPTQFTISGNGVAPKKKTRAAESDSGGASGTRPLTVLH